MSLNGLLNQSITVYNAGGYGADGRPTYATGTSTKARVEIITKRVLLPDGTILTVDAFMICKADVTINTDDKVTYGSINYKVIDVFDVPGGDGNTHHKEVRLQKWPT